MKFRFLNLAVFMLLGLTLSAQEWVEVSGNTRNGFSTSLVEATDDVVTINVSLDGFTKTMVGTDRGEAWVISAPKMVSMLEEGAPDLPMSAIPVIIGDDAKMNVEVVSSRFVDFENVLVAPSKGNLKRTVNPDDVPFSFGKLYSTDEFYPTQTALDLPYVQRDFRGQNILVRPFTYNAKTQTLRVYFDMQIVMSKVGTDNRNVIVRNSNNITTSREFMQTYERRYINFGQRSASYTFLVDEGKMLVVCYPSFAEDMQPFVDWKKISGRPTELVTTTETGTTDTQILNYISNLYTTDPTLTYILLVGDLSQMTSHYDSSAGGRTDSWYGRLVGNDNYNELIVGRFSCENTTHVQTHVNKVLNYERDLDETATWLSTGIGIGANEGSGSGHNGGEADYVHINYIRDTLLNYTYTTVHKDYSGVGSGTSSAQISSQINNGAGIINYCNHGSVTSWSVANYGNSHVNNLTNSYKLPFIWSTACNNGQFDQTCFAEAWMRATNNNTGEPTGAVATLMSWISQPWTPPMTGQDEMVNVLTEHVSPLYRHTYGGASVNGCMKILDLHPSDQGDTYKTWILFGDPSLMCRTKAPVPMQVAHPTSIMIGSNTFALTAPDADGAIATLSLNNQPIGSAIIENGVANMTIDPITTEDTVKLIVIGYNRVTYQADIEVVPSNQAYISINSYEVDDAAGNNNGMLNNGETAYVDFTIKNVGTIAAGSLSVKFSCDDEYVSCDTNTIFQITNALAPEATFAVNNVLNIETQTYTPNGHNVVVYANITSDDLSWMQIMVIPVAAPEIKLLNQPTLLTSSGSTTLLPSEICSLNIPLANKGGYMAENVKVWLESDNEFVGFANAPLQMETFDVDTTIVTLYMSVSNLCPVDSKVNIWVKAHAGFNEMYSDSICLTFNVGGMQNMYMTNGFFEVDEAHFYDSGGPDNGYGSNQNYTMVIKPSKPNHMMRVTFQSFRTEATYDVLKIYDASTPVDSALRKSLSGSLNAVSLANATVTATNPDGALTFKFNSDYGYYWEDYEGWKATLTSVYAGDPYVEAGISPEVCYSDVRSLYVNTFGATASSISWQPADLLNDATSSNPVATISEPTWFYVTVNDSLTDSVFVDHVEMFTDIDSKIENGNLNMCFNYGMTETLDASIDDENVSYTWIPTGETTPSITINTADFNYMSDTTINYSVIISNEYGCQYVRSFNLVLAECGVDVEEMSENEVSIYPNPAQTQVTVACPISADDFSYTIYNLQGQQVANREMSSFAGNATINVEQLPNGIYFLQVNLDGHFFSKKLVIEK